MSRLEQAINTIVEIFVEYADGDGKLSKDELKKMMETEIQNPEILSKFASGDFDKAMGWMDKNRDGELDFKEFSKCVGCMLKCHHGKKTGRGKGCDKEAGN